MPGTILRWLGGGLALAFILWAVLTVSAWKDKLREEGRQEVTRTIQQDNIDNLLKDREVTSLVLEERELQRARHEASSTQAQKEIHTAPKATKATGIDIDRPLPDSIVSPLLMQYQTITRCQGGESQSSCGLDDGASHTGAAQGADRPKSGPVVQ